MPADDDGPLAGLAWHWGSAYEISYERGQYRAVRRDDGSVVRADTAGELLREIRADYAVRPVPRGPSSRCGPGTASPVRPGS